MAKKEQLQIETQEQSEQAQAIEFVPVCDGFTCDKNTGVLYYMGGNTPVAIANHTPILTEWKEISDGVNSVEHLVFRTYRGRDGNGKSISGKSVELTREQIWGGAEPFVYFEVGNLLYPGVRLASKLYRTAMEMQSVRVNKSVVYTRLGFAVVNGVRVYMNGQYSVTANGLTDEYKVEIPNEESLTPYFFTAEKHEERYNTLFNLFRLGCKKLIYTGLAFTFITPFNAMLRELKIEPRFTLYLTGKTGSNKTTMAGIFLSFFGSFGDSTPAVCSFDDTANYVGERLGLFDSFLVLMDDKTLDYSVSDKNAKDNVEARLARQAGDRRARGRLNRDGSTQRKQYLHGNVIVTAEQAYARLNQSDIARSMSVDVGPDTITDNEKLLSVQNNKIHLNECMSEFIQYLLVNWDAIKEEIKPLRDELRARAQFGGHKRLSENVAYLQLGIIYLCKWLVSVGQMTETRAAELQDDTWKTFMQLAREQNALIAEESPTDIYLNAVREMLSTKEIRVTPIDGAFGGAFTGKESPFVGVYDDDFYYLISNQVYQKVYARCEKAGGCFPLGEKALNKELAKEKIVEAGTSQITRPKRINDKLVKCLFIHRRFIDGEEAAEIETGGADNEQTGET